MNILNVMTYEKLTMLNISIIQLFGFKAINKHNNAKNCKNMHNLFAKFYKKN